MNHPFIALHRTLLLAVICSGWAAGDDLDWPTWRYDNARSAGYPQDLPEALHLQWTYQAPHKPKEAWPGTAQSDWWRKRGTPEQKRIVFDQVYEVVGAGDRLYYGSSSDDQLRCLDLKTGAVLWTFYAEAPIRLAPTVSGDRLLVGSDDGRVYALDRKTGGLLWKAAAPEAGPERLPGNGRVISLFPVRSGVMVRGGQAFFCSGLFPKSAGAWHCSVAVDTGRHLGRFKRSGGCGTISASANSLYFRAGNPTAYDLETGINAAINNVSRPGCWINMIPAAGLLLVPEGSSGCVCNFAIQGSMAFAPK